MSDDKYVGCLEDIKEFLLRRRKQCIVHRILYYAWDAPIITDIKYTRWENELRDLCARYPELSVSLPYYEFCPSHTVGSDDISTYPLELVRIAECLRAYMR